MCQLSIFIFYKIRGKQGNAFNFNKLSALRYFYFHSAHCFQEFLGFARAPATPAGQAVPFRHSPFRRVWAVRGPVDFRAMRRWAAQRAGVMTRGFSRGMEWPTFKPRPKVYYIDTLVKGIKPELEPSVCSPQPVMPRGGAATEPVGTSGAGQRPIAVRPCGAGAGRAQPCDLGESRKGKRS